MKKMAAGLLWCVASAASRAEMSPLSNEDMERVEGQAGVAVSIDYRLNADENGAVLSYCTAPATYKECRYGWAFSNRGADDVNKQWLVLKGFSGALLVPYLTVDASSVTYVSDGEDGTSGAVTLPALKLGFGNPTGGGAAANNTPVQIKNLVIDGIAFERDTATRRGYFADATTEPTGAAVPANKNTGFLALQISARTPGGSSIVDVPALLRVDGTMRLYSCTKSNPAC